MRSVSAWVPEKAPWLLEGGSVGLWPEQGGGREGIILQGTSHGSREAELDEEPLLFLPSHSHHLLASSCPVRASLPCAVPSGSFTFFPALHPSSHHTFFYVLVVTVVVINALFCSVKPRSDQTCTINFFLLLCLFLLWKISCPLKRAYFINLTLIWWILFPEFLSFFFF
jgi:hypothetical protein